MSATVDAFLITIPPLVVYLTVGLVVGLESLGVPLPGEIVLVSAALLSSRHELDISPGWIALAATAGAVIGDSIGYGIGHRYGMGLFAWAGRKMPRHFGPSHVRAAERLFARWGVLAVFFGRFVALLRIFAGPIAGALLGHRDVEGLRKVLLADRGEVGKAEGQRARVEERVHARVRHGLTRRPPPDAPCGA